MAKHIKKAQAGLKASNKRVGPVDPNGAWTKVQEMNLPPRDVKTKLDLSPNKQLGATKMAKKGINLKKAQDGVKKKKGVMTNPYMQMQMEKRKLDKRKFDEDKLERKLKPLSPSTSGIRGGLKAKGGKWIQKAIKKPGALRAQLGAKPGKPIPAAKLAKAAKAKGKLGQRARLAQTLKKMSKK